MKKTLAAICAAALFATPALAASMTIEFAQEGGETQSWTFEPTSETGGTYTAPDGSTGDYTWDKGSNTLCGMTAEGELCATFEAANNEPAVGDTSAYTSSDGSSGTATITALTE